MIVSDGYEVVYNKNTKQILITLPASTNSKHDITEEDEDIILTLVRLLYEKLF